MFDYKVVMTDNIFPDLEIERRMLSAVNAEFILVPKGEDIGSYTADADVVVNTYARVTADIIARMEKCRMVIRNGIGVDTIDVRACTEKGIMVANVPHYCSDEVSTHTMALILALTRKLKPMNCAVSRGVWDVKQAMPMYSLKDKVLGLVGFGKIPRLVVEKARVFDMKVIAYDPFVSEADMGACYVEKVSMEELTAKSDVISIHCPLNDKTRNTFNMDVFRRMKPTAYLINAARAPIVNEPDLIAALQQGMIAGAGLDLLADNGADADNPLLHMEQVIVTPHSAWYSEESIVRRRTQTMESVIAVLQGDEPPALCNRAELLRR